MQSLVYEERQTLRVTRTQWLSPWELSVRCRAWCTPSTSTKTRTAHWYSFSLRQEVSSEFSKVSFQVTDGSSRQISITFRDGQCGLTRSPSQVLSQSPRSVLIWIVEDSVLSLQARDGYNYNITVILQFHPLIITRADQVRFDTNKISNIPKDKLPVRLYKEFWDI